MKCFSIQNDLAAFLGIYTKYCSRGLCPSGAHKSGKANNFSLIQ